MKTIGTTLILFAFLIIGPTCYGQIPILKDYYAPLPKVVTPGQLSADGGCYSTIRCYFFI